MRRHCQRMLEHFLKLSIAVSVLCSQQVTAGECTEDQIPCQLLAGSEAPWDGILMTYAQLASYEASLEKAEKQVASLMSDLDDVVGECRKEADAIRASYETRLSVLQKQLSDMSPVVVETTEWYEYLLWGAIGAAVGGAIVGALWLGTVLSSDERGARGTGFIAHQTTGFRGEHAPFTQGVIV